MFSQKNFIIGFTASFIYNGTRRSGEVVETNPTFIKLKHDDGSYKSYNYNKMVLSN